VFCDRGDENSEKIQRETGELEPRNWWPEGYPQGKPYFSDLTELSVQALACYREQRWAEALQLLEQVLQLRPEDGPARLMIARCRTYQATPPPPEWEGVHRTDRK
jgi:hypothetical protein